MVGSPPISPVHSDRLADRGVIRQAVTTLNSDFNLLRKFQGVGYLDAEIADRALEFAMAEQELTGA